MSGFLSFQNKLISKPVCPLCSWLITFSRFWRFTCSFILSQILSGWVFVNIILLLSFCLSIRAFRISSFCGCSSSTFRISFIYAKKNSRRKFSSWSPLSCPSFISYLFLVILHYFAIHVQILIMLINHSQLFWYYHIIFYFLLSELWNTNGALNSCSFLIHLLRLPLVIRINFSSEKYIIFIFLLRNWASFLKINILYYRIIILSNAYRLLSSNILTIDVNNTLVSSESFVFIWEWINWWSILFLFLIFIEYHNISLIV